MELFPNNLQQSRKGRPAEKKLDYLFTSLGQSVWEKTVRGGGVGIADLTSLWIPIDDFNSGGRSARPGENDMKRGHKGLKLSQYNYGVLLE